MHALFIISIVRVSYTHLDVYKRQVVAAFADMYGFTQEQSLRMAASFGGGIGRMRETLSLIHI